MSGLALRAFDFGFKVEESTEVLATGPFRRNCTALTIHCRTAVWEFPKIGDTNIVPN